MAFLSLRGRTALVTGSTKGIGKAIAHELRELGARVVGTARTVEEEGAAETIQADVSRREDRERLIDEDQDGPRSHSVSQCRASILPW